MYQTKTQIGWNLQDARRKADLTQKELADKLNQYSDENKANFPKEYSRRDIEQMENGRKEIRFPGLVIALADILETNCHTLLTGYAPEDMNIVNDLGLSTNALVSLRAHDYAGNVLSFFADNDLIELLATIKRYIQSDSQWQNVEGVGNVDVTDSVRLGIAEAIKTFRTMYHQRKRKEKDGGEIDNG